MQSEFMPELHRWISKLVARHMQIFHHGYILITMVKETVILYKKEFRKMNRKKLFLSLVWKWWKREKTARLPVTVLSVQTWFYM